MVRANKWYVWRLPLMKPNLHLQVPALSIGKVPLTGCFCTGGPIHQIRLYQVSTQGRPYMPEGMGQNTTPGVTQWKCSITVWSSLFCRDFYMCKTRHYFEGRVINVNSARVASFLAKISHLTKLSLHSVLGSFNNNNNKSLFLTIGFLKSGWWIR